MPFFSKSRFIGAVVLISFTVLLASCGGGEPTESTKAQSNPSLETMESTPQNISPTPTPDFVAAMEESGQLNVLELQAAEKAASLPIDSSYPASLLSTNEFAYGVQKLASKQVPIYRFFNSSTSAHFFTASETEKNDIRARLPVFRYEGIAFYASPTPARGLSAVYRFFNGATGVHLFTISENEKNNIQRNIPQFSYEGIAYYASQVAAAGTSGIRRFFVRDRGFHFYSSSAEEAARIRATLPNYVDEGLAYYALNSSWVPPVDVDLTVGSWILTANDTSGSSWSGSTLTFTQQVVSGNNYTLLAHVNFVRNGLPNGSEDFRGTLYGNGRLEMSGYSVPPGFNLTTADWQALLNVPGNQFLNGSWSRPDGMVIAGNWTAVR